jgi:non-lysosomal glucosylceramidase
MNYRIRRRAAVLLLCCADIAWAGDAIPKAAWTRPIGLPLADAGTKKPTLDKKHIDDGYWQGAPVGGFGAGTFSRSYRGDFSRWHLKGGVHKYQTIYANEFAVYQKSEDAAHGVAQVLLADHPKQGELSAWKWDYPVGAGNYYALYPKSWFDYKWDQLPAHIMLEQFSPILPNNYRESSYPLGVFRWHAENPTPKSVTVSFMFSWTNMVGWLRTFSTHLDEDLSAGNRNRFVSEENSSGRMKGIVFDRARNGPVKDEWDGQFVIATIESPGVEVSYHTTFRPGTDGADVWDPFASNGKLDNNDENWISSDEPLAGAIAVRFTLKPGERRVIPMVVAWDLPVVEFGSGRKWLRHYTAFYGAGGTNAWKIARDGLANAAQWSDAIDAWQAPYLNNESKPEWYRGMLFNEMYILADGGSFWGRQMDSDPKAPDTFAFMECYDYPYYATLDVRFYGSMPLVRFWPELDKQELRQFAATVPQDLNEKYIWLWKSQRTHKVEFRVRKAKGAVPHDLGAPQEDPFAQVNQFSWQNTNGWKDLNSKFVLMVYRDYVFTGRTDLKFLTDAWPAVKDSLEYLRQFDRDGDGLPENDGYPDQTYDEWVVRGESAYCGGLWLAALRAAEEIALALKESQVAAKYHDLFAKSQASYIGKLWNGEYFRYDTESEYRDNIQADQLAGQWYANMTGLGDLVPLDMQQKTLKKIFDFNVMKFANGQMGAVNGMNADGTVPNTNEQVQEVWTGTTLALAALMLGDGMEKQAYFTARGVYSVTYEKKGYWFRTPEAWDRTGNYRASMYMRPAAVWAMEMTRPPEMR